MFALAPLVAAAQATPTATSSTNWWQYRGGYGGNSTTTYMGGYGHNQISSAAQQEVAALATMSTGPVTMPVLFGVGVKDISPNFGDPRDNGTRTHEGEDIMAVKGTPVVSPTLAVVLEDQVGAGEGNAVYTANPGGETFVYMHLDRFGEGVVPGTILQPGALIGYVGNTGDAAGGPAHLHLEIHNPAGTPTDPFPRLTLELTLQQKISDLAPIFAAESFASSTALAQLLVSNFRGTFIAALAANIALPQPIVTALATTLMPTAGTNAAITRNLYKGIVGEDVRTLQKLLNAHGYTVATSGAGSAGQETTYFGPATLAAVIAYQKAHSIVPAVGYVGPITRASLATLQ